ncbi:MAG: molecular chaperone TorD family protein [Thermofilum sp.]
MREEVLHRERAVLYEALSLAFTHPTYDRTLELLEEVVEKISERNALWRVVRSDLPPAFADSWLAALRGDRARLLEEYTRLFVLGSPKPLCPPYESLHLGSAYLAGPSYEHLLRLLGSAGLEVREDVGEPAEHVSVMFELMKALTLMYLGTGELRFICLQALLVEEHLGRWIHVFAGCIERNANLECFRVSAELARELVAADRNLLRPFSKRCAEEYLKPRS